VPYRHRELGWPKLSGHFKQVFHIGDAPAISRRSSHPHTSSRHTFDNILNKGFLTINHICENILPAAHQSSARYCDTQSEFDSTGLQLRQKAKISLGYRVNAFIKIELSTVADVTLRNRMTETSQVDFCELKSGIPRTVPLSSDGKIITKSPKIIALY